MSTAHRIEHLCALISIYLQEKFLEMTQKRLNQAAGEAASSPTSSPNSEYYLSIFFVFTNVADKHAMSPLLVSPYVRVKTNLLIICISL